MTTTYRPHQADHHAGVYRREHRQMRLQRHRQVRRLLPARTWQHRFEVATVVSIYAVIGIVAGICALLGGYLIVRFAQSHLGG